MDDRMERKGKEREGKERKGRRVTKMERANGLDLLSRQLSLCVVDPATVLRLLFTSAFVINSFRDVRVRKLDRWGGYVCNACLSALAYRYIEIQPRAKLFRQKLLHFGACDDVFGLVGWNFVLGEDDGRRR